MFVCHVCGSNEAREETVNEIFFVEGKFVLVENIPATICTRCGEPTFSRETTEKIRQMVHGETQPVKSIKVDVFEFA
ncbi:MAG: YgiT-type zinc finger protein [Anaerolineae bacterium]|nr:YgiT-type zinc finger protein [Anaerolineae bacterium]